MLSAKWCASRTIPIVLELFSTATTTMAGSNEARLTHIAVRPCSSPSCFTVRAERPERNRRSTVSLAASFMATILLRSGAAATRGVHYLLSHGDTHATRAPGRQVAVEGRPHRHVSRDAPVAPHRRQGGPAQAAEQDLLPDLGITPRGRPSGRRQSPAARLQLVLSQLSRPRPMLVPRHDADRDAARGGS